MSQIVNHFDSFWSQCKNMVSTDVLNGTFYLFIASGCRLGDASTFLVPHGSSVRLPDSTSNLGCYQSCVCGNNNLLENCQPLRCEVPQQCIVSGQIKGEVNGNRQNYHNLHKIFKNDTILTHLHKFDIHNIHIQCLIMKKDPFYVIFWKCLILYLVIRVSAFGLVPDT